MEDNVRSIQPFNSIFKAQSSKKTLPTEKREVPSFSSTLVDSFKALRSVEDLDLVPLRSDVFTISDNESEESESVKVLFELLSSGYFSNGYYFHSG